MIWCCITVLVRELERTKLGNRMPTGRKRPPRNDSEYGGRGHDEGKSSKDRCTNTTSVLDGRGVTCWHVMWPFPTTLRLHFELAFRDPGTWDPIPYLPYSSNQSLFLSPLNDGHDQDFLIACFRWFIFSTTARHYPLQSLQHGPEEFPMCDPSWDSVEHNQLSLSSSTTRIAHRNNVKNTSRIDQVAKTRVLRYSGNGSVYWRGCDWPRILIATVVCGLPRLFHTS